jgi:hypothetical protein
MSGQNGRKQPARYYHLPCKVQPGMFQDELLAIFEGMDPAAGGGAVKVQLFVDSNLVADIQGTPQRGREVDARLVVELIRTTNGLAVIALPQPAVPVGPTAVVRNEQLAQVP